MVLAKVSIIENDFLSSFTGEKSGNHQKVIEIIFFFSQKVEDFCFAESWTILTFYSIESYEWKWFSELDQIVFFFMTISETLREIISRMKNYMNRPETPSRYNKCKQSMATKTFRWSLLFCILDTCAKHCVHTWHLSFISFICMSFGYFSVHISLQIEFEEEEERDNHQRKDKIERWTVWSLEWKT